MRKRTTLTVKTQIFQLTFAVSIGVTISSKLQRLPEEM